MCVMTGEELREWRKVAGYKTQADAADALGTPVRTYQRWERAKEVDRVVELATQALAMKAAWPAAIEGIRVLSRLVRH